MLIFETVKPLYQQTIYKNELNLTAFQTFNLHIYV